jgi:hypothetical protein
METINLIKIYECKICDKQYKTYHTLWVHNKKFHEKKEKVKEYTCEKCNKKFDNKQNKYYHQKKCIITSTQEIIEPSNNNLLVPETTINNINANIQNSNNNSNNTINNGTINQHIIINNYNNDNLEYISEKFKLNLFNSLLNGTDHIKPIPKLIENIKFNPNHKENNNVKITSDRAKIGFYYDDNKWRAINKDELLNDLCDYSLKKFTEYFEEYKNNLSDDIKEKYKSFSHIAKLKSQLRKDIKEKIENIAYIFTKNIDLELDV